MNKAIPLKQINFETLLHYLHDLVNNVNGLFDFVTNWSKNTTNYNFNIMRVFRALVCNIYSYNVLLQSYKPS